MPLPKVQRNVQDQQGNIVPGVLGSVYNQGTGVLASLYQDDAGTMPLSNPMTNDATYGSFKFYINPGHFDMTFTKPGYTFEPVYDMQVPQDVLTLGTMATQNANAVAITGGTATLVGLTVNGNATVSGQATAGGLAVTGNATVGGTASLTGLAVTGNASVSGVMTGGTASLTGLDVTGNASVSGTATAGGLSVTGNATVGGTATVNGLAVNGNTTMTGTASMAELTVTQRQGIARAPHGAARLALTYPNPTEYGILTQAGDTGASAPLVFLNSAAGTVGTITTTDSATAYNTSSDVRLKHAIATLAGALDRVRALRPVAFRWNADDSSGVGFLAHELQQHIPEAVTGEPDEVNDDGSVRPQGVDHSKLVPWLTSAVQALLARVETLEAQVAALQP
jgi:Chaperone of endosialidase